jgi:MATE family multidrug resistance protein
LQQPPSPPAARAPQPPLRPARLTGRIAALAWPILIGQLAVIGNSVIDTMMTSRYSATDLAALALGGSIYISVFFGLNGILQALTPIIGHLFGARDYKAIGMELKQGLWLALFLAGIGTVLLSYPQPLLGLAQAAPAMTAKATQYLRALAFALPAGLGFVIFSALNNALARPKMVMTLQVAALLLKIPLNALFIYGAMGVPAFGGPGCAIATALISWLMLGAALLILRLNPFYAIFDLFDSGFVAPHWRALGAILKLGVPMGLSYFIEVTSFALMALFIARFGDAALSGHQITANFGAILYMLPISIASATGTLVAQALGAREPLQARAIGMAGIRLAMCLSSIIGATIWLARDVIAHAYTPNPAIIAAALPLFMFISFYQLFDATQTVTAFVLRAYRAAVIPTVMNAVALWGVGLGGGYLLGIDPFGLGLPTATHGAAGFWISNSASLVVLAAGLTWYLRKVQRDFRLQPMPLEKSA